MFDDLPLFRSTDPETSKQGAQDVLPRRGSQQALILAVYRNRQLTDEEAGYLSGLALRPKCCYWKRCSELRHKGLIEWTGETRLGTSGSAMKICTLTQAGAELLASWQ
jgi:hypothetical protein